MAARTRDDLRDLAERSAARRVDEHVRRHELGRRGAARGRERPHAVLSRTGPATANTPTPRALAEPARGRPESALPSHDPARPHAELVPADSRGGAMARGRASAASRERDPLPPGVAPASRGRRGRTPGRRHRARARGACDSRRIVGVVLDRARCRGRALAALERAARQRSSSPDGRGALGAGRAVVAAYARCAAALPGRAGDRGGGHREPVGARPRRLPASRGRRAARAGLPHRGQRRSRSSVAGPAGRRSTRSASARAASGFERRWFRCGMAV